MRYFKHLALWTLCGLLVVGLAGALAGALVGGASAWATIHQHDAALTGVGIGGFLGGYSGAICGFVALLCLAIPRRPVGAKSAARLRRALAVVGGFVLSGTPILTVGFGIVALVALRLLEHASPSYGLNVVVGWVLYAHFLFVAFPAIVGAIAATRALRRFEAGVPHVLTQSPS